MLLVICVMIINVVNITAQLLIQLYAPELAGSQQAWSLMFLSLLASLAALGIMAMYDANIHRNAWFIPLMGVTLILGIHAGVKLAKIVYLS